MPTKGQAHQGPHPVVHDPLHLFSTGYLKRERNTVHRKRSPPSDTALCSDL